MVLLFLWVGLIPVLRGKIQFKSIIKKDNFLLKYTLAYIVLCVIYLYIPHFHPETPSFLGFRYDIFFLLAFLAGYLFDSTSSNIKTLLKYVFFTTTSIVVIFLLWYIFFDIWTTVGVFWFSSRVSVFNPFECLSFSQNIIGNHRLQATFWWPIRYSVYLVVVYFILLGAFMDTKMSVIYKKYIYVMSGTLLILLSIFFSYSKTSYIGFLLGAIIFLFMSWKMFMKNKFPQKYLQLIIVFGVLFGIGWMYIYRDLFLHIGSMLKRFENLLFSFELLRDNIFWYGLGIAGPASTVATLSNYFEPFLPENWYIQVWLETGIVGLFLLLNIIWLIGKRLFWISLGRKEYYWIGLFCAFVSLCVMALFTHSFEEAATSYLLFFLIGIQLKNTL